MAMKGEWCWGAVLPGEARKRRAGQPLFPGLQGRPIPRCGFRAATRKLALGTSLRRKPFVWEVLGDATQRCFFLNLFVVVVFVLP